MDFYSASPGKQTNTIWNIEQASMYTAYIVIYTDSVEAANSIIERHQSGLNLQSLAH